MFGKTSPTSPSRTVSRSALLPDDYSEFERAAMEQADPDLAPPYDPDVEERSVARGPSGGRKPTKRATRALSEVLFLRDRFRLKVMRGHIRWAHKQAVKSGIVPSEVNLWEV